MSLSWPEIKDPDARKDYSIRWAKWLRDDTIAASEWILPEGIETDEDSFTDTTTTVWLLGGTPGTYACTNRITTAGERIEDRTVTVTVGEQ